MSEVVSRGTVVIEAAKIDISKQRYIRWAWRTTDLPTGGDIRDDDKNDQALQILVGFPKTILGARTLSYVWDTTAPVGTDHCCSPQ